MRKIKHIFFNALPILVMIGLIPFVANDYVLAALYAVIILIAFFIKRMSHDIFIFVFGFFTMIACEYLFVSTGVETFIRNSLFGLMPLWPPFLWGYSFVAIKRSVALLGA